MTCGFGTMTAYMRHTVCPIDTVTVIKPSFGSQQRCASCPVCVVLWLCGLVEVMQFEMMIAAPSCHSELPQTRPTDPRLEAAFISQRQRHRRWKRRGRSYSVGAYLSFRRNGLPVRSGRGERRGAHLLRGRCVRANLDRQSGMPVAIYPPTQRRGAGSVSWRQTWRCPTRRG